MSVIVHNCTSYLWIWCKVLSSTQMMMHIHCCAHVLFTQILMLSPLLFSHVVFSWFWSCFVYTFTRSRCADDQTAAERQQSILYEHRGPLCVLIHIQEVVPVDGVRGSDTVSCDTEEQLSAELCSSALNYPAEILLLVLAVGELRSSRGRVLP